MKRVLSLILAVLVVSLASSYVLFGVVDTNSTSVTGTGTETKPAKPVSRRALKADSTTITKVAADANVAEPNAAKSKSNVFEDLDKALDDIVKENEEGRVERTQKSAENRVRNIKLFYAHVATELGLVRKVALEEKAEKTVEAIDRILESRNKRLESRLAEIEDERKVERQRLREERIEKERERRQKIEEDRRRDREPSR